MKKIRQHGSAFMKVLVHGIILAGMTLKLSALGVWSSMSVPTGSGLYIPELMSDGSVMIIDNGGNCFRLTPDIHGSYTNGTWSALTSLTYSRWNFGVATLTNGNLLVVGGEYGGGSAPGSYWNGSTFVNGSGQTCEIFNPLNNVWSQSNPNLLLGDCDTEQLPNGDVFISPANNSGLCGIYHVSSNYWEYGLIGAATGWDEAPWCKLPNGCIFGTDIAGNGEHYVPATRQWIFDGPSSAQSGVGERTVFLLPNGTVFDLQGGAGIYTPGSTPSTVGSWSAGPAFPTVNGNTLSGEAGGSEGGGMTLPNGNIMFHLFDTNGTTYGYEYNYQNNTFTANQTFAGVGYGVILPDGNVFFQGGLVYKPDGSPLFALGPVINSVTENADGMYHLVGLRLTGFTEGQCAIDDGQSPCHIPLVRLTNNLTGNVYYARTFNWSTAAIQTGTNVVTTEFSLPANLPAGTYSVVAVANGIASAPTTLTYSPLAAPTGLAVVAGNNQAALTWNVVSGATAYNIKRFMSGNPGYYATVGTVSGISFTDSNLVNLAAYSYVVSSVGANGESANSTSVSVTPFGPPATPTGLTAVSDTFGRITLGWTSIPGYFTNYNIKRSTVSGGPYTTVATSANPFYTDSGLLVGQTYYYVVSALNPYGEGGNSTEASSVSQNIANPGFEQPPYNSGNYVYNPTDGGWTFNGASPNGSGMLANGTAFGNANAPEGLKAAFVQSTAAISQTLSGFVPGQSYVLTYSAAQRSGYSQTWNVKIDNTVIQTNNTPGGTSYANYTATFMATAPIHTLSFVGTDLAGNNDTVFLDNVAIWPVTPNYGGNFGFESPTVGNYQYNPTGATWTFSGASPNGSGIIANGSGFGNPNAPQGVQAAFVQTYGSISQTLTNLTPGQTYTVSYLAAQRVNFNAGGETWNVMIDTSVIQSNNVPGGTSYMPYSAMFTATSSSHTLKFVGTDFANNQNTVFIDNVVVGVPLQPLPPPTITFAGVTNGSVLDCQRSISLTASVTANGNNITSVQYFYDLANPIGSALTVAPYSYAWLPSLIGRHTVFARVFYNNGNHQDSPAVTADFFSVLPATAADVIGSAVTFVASNSIFNPVSYQWQKIASGVTNDIVGATNATLTFANLQLSDAASYQVVMSGAGFTGVSKARPLIVNSVPAAVNNVITAYAAQTGLGNSVTANFYPTWTIPSGSLIGGQAPSSVGAGNFGASGGTISALTDNSLGYIHSVPGNGGGPDQVTCGTVASGAGQSVTYTLPVGAYAYNLTKIAVYGGWGDAGRDQQAYTIYYAKQSAPTTFIQLGSANYNPSNSLAVQSATRATFTGANTYLATNVVALKFDFTTPAGKNGYEGYSEIQVFGVTSGISIAVTNAYGSANTYPYTPPWSVPANGDLILKQPPSSSSGNFNQWPISGQTRNVNFLTSGGNLTISQVSGLPGTNYVVCGNDGSGASVTYTLTGAGGYNLTNITVYGGWQDNGRDAQDYTVYYSTVDAPENFIPLTLVSFNPTGVPDNTPSATRVTMALPDGGIMASNVAVVKFDFTSPLSENGDCGYAQIAMYGTANIPPAVATTISGVELVSGNNLVMHVGGMVIGRHYEVESTTDLASGVWTIESSLTATTDCASFTNAIAADGQKFYRINGY